MPYKRTMSEDRTKTKLSIRNNRILLFGKDVYDSTCCEIHGLYLDNDQTKSIALLHVSMCQDIEGFTYVGDDISRFQELCSFVDGLFGLLLRNDKETATLLKAARKIIYAKELGIGKTNISQLLKWRTIPSAEAHAWFWFDLIMKVITVVEPIDPSRDYVGSRIRMKKDLPQDHPLVQIVEKHLKPGKMNTAQSVARSIYDSLIDEYEIKKPDKATTKKELQRFVRYKKVREADSAPFIQQLKIEGFDYDAVMMATGLNRNMGEKNQR